MIEKSHAELQKWHYQALSNPMYLMEGRLDVLREEMMLNFSPIVEIPVKNETIEVVKNVSFEEVQQIRGQLQYLQRKLQELTTKKKRNYNNYV